MIESALNLWTVGQYLDFMAWCDKHCYELSELYYVESGKIYFDLENTEL